MDLPAPLLHSLGDLGHFQGFGGDYFGLSLQDMIDTDLAGNLNHLEAFELWNDLDPVEDVDIDDTLPKATARGQSLERQGGLNPFLEDLTVDCSVLVNPISVMPIHPLHPQKQTKKEDTPTTVKVVVSEVPETTTPTPVTPKNPTPVGQINKAITLKTVTSPLQQTPARIPSNSGPQVALATASPRKKLLVSLGKENGFPKPAYSYSCLIALALKNSPTGSMMVSEIYKFMCKHFPYFKTAPSGWKNSVRHNLSLNKCFEKIEKPSTNGSHRKGCLWAMNPAKINKMDEEVAKWSRKDPIGIKKGMLIPDNLNALERGELVAEDGLGDQDSDDNDDPKTPNSVSSRESKESDATLESSDVEMGSQGSDDVIEVDAFDGLTDLDLHETTDIFDDYDVESPGFFQANYSIVTTGMDLAKEF